MKETPLQNFRVFGSLLDLGKGFCPRVGVCGPRRRRDQPAQHADSAQPGLVVLAQQVDLFERCQRRPIHAGVCRGLIDGAARPQVESDALPIMVTFHAEIDIRRAPGRSQRDKDEQKELCRAEVLYVAEQTDEPLPRPAP